MGESREREGLFGKYTEHFDDEGNKVGESRERDGFFGKYSEHTDAEGNKVGESREREGFFGNYTEHTGSSGSKTGESRDRDGFFGPYTEHLDAHDNKVGESRERDGFFGKYTEHTGTGWLPKAPSRVDSPIAGKSLGPSVADDATTSSPGAAPDGSPSPRRFGVGGAILLLVIFGIVGSILTTSHEREIKSLSGEAVRIPQQQLVRTESDVQALAKPPSKMMQVDECLLYKCGERLRTKTEVPVLSEPSPSSSVIGAVDIGFEFEPITAAWVTNEPTVVRVRDRSVAEENPGYSFEVGDFIYLYAYWGEGCYTAWTKGVLYGYFEEGHRPGGSHVFMKSMISCIMINPDLPVFERVREGVATFWIKLRLNDGRIGWVKSEDDNLEPM
jgi:hypothetical protein